jgi:hypothetical protein
MKGNEPAFPIGREDGYRGLTKREWYAGMAMQLFDWTDPEIEFDLLVEDCFRIATAMCEEADDE